MWKPKEIFFIRYHIAVSAVTLLLGLALLYICLTPQIFPALSELLLDDRVSVVIPYLLFIAVGQSAFSVWYFLFRKSG
ncbi:MAG: hypothetical protein PHN84_13350 [Desulfuromonadaceae bacterium]|nr:hypothetical protein [Desulfuromonadaceae bacterium]MDD2855577.1 hypothetical protein [Desulfuromonadaceae bacterium]